MVKHKQLRIAYDFDGVIATEEKGWFSDLMWKLFPRWWCVEVHKKAKHTGVIPEESSCILTGRIYREKSLTLKQMQDWGMIDNLLVIDIEKKYPDRESSIRFKIKMIKELGIEIFHENDNKVIKALEETFGNKLKIIKH